MTPLQTLYALEQEVAAIRRQVESHVCDPTPAPDREGGSDIEVIENLEALAALTGDHEGILRAAIDRITALEQKVAELKTKLTKGK